ncbi:hypothetical protein J6590_062880 [Homalodisca vitripennis]|nr:hypothetical protein J6590_062880 [Homalodisca vitripennis]
MTAVISCKPQHSGHHPVTMRSLASPKAGCTTPSAAAVVETKTNLTSTTPPSRTATSPPDIQDTTQNYIIETPDILTHSTPNIPTKNNVSINIDQLELENSSLKNTITDLKKQLRDVTDRAIASDTRLLQYTNEVFELPHGFVGNICLSITTVVDEQLGTRVEDNDADEDSARVHESSTHVAGSPGDSHSRHLASLMCKNSRGTNIGGICKPGAGLLSVTPALVHPPDHCCVLLAGTNDVAAGKQDIIFSKLEKIVKDCCSSSALLVLSLSTRHDLPSDSPVHQTTALVNNYIALVYPLRGRGNAGFQQHGSQPLHPTRPPSACKWQTAGQPHTSEDLRYDASAPSPRHCSNCADPFHTLSNTGPRHLALQHLCRGCHRDITTTDILNASMKTV